MREHPPQCVLAVSTTDVRVMGQRCSTSIHNTLSGPTSVLLLHHFLATLAVRVAQVRNIKHAFVLQTPFHRIPSRRPKGQGC